jgi:ubiquinone/menaquinone biosynthesis C-methylase UbiE
MTEAEVKQQVRQFYDQVGWQTVSDGTYQNARYEDLRPVSREYIHRCHLRVKRFLRPEGRYLLDAGSGPVQYPEYLTYSAGYRYRVCVDISMVALQEARRRIGDHGLFVVADVANLPFVTEPFDGVVSLHTLHHLPLEEQGKAYLELFRVLKPGCSAVVVNGWTDSPLMRRLNWLVRGMESLGALVKRVRGGDAGTRRRGDAEIQKEAAPSKAGPGMAAQYATVGSQSVQEKAPVGTFIRKLDAGWMEEQIGGCMRYDIHSWRSVSVRFLRAVIHDITGGRLWLRLLYWLEDCFPRFFGEKGQYPLIVIRK